MILHGDCLEQLKTLPDSSVDSVVTDPPYGLSFMGKKWDYSVPSIDVWREVFRVLKPGGHLLSFGGTRTYHRLVVAIEDAGFEIRDQIQWIYGSGFPKSMDVSKAIDKQAGVEREVVGYTENARPNRVGKETKLSGKQTIGGEITLAQTDAAKLWQGWGTALKPANEPICVARKPLSEPTVAKNVLKHGTGALNIDASRIEGIADVPFGRQDGINGNGKTMSKMVQTEFKPHALGRWPANVIFDECAAAALDEQSGSLSKQGSRKLKDCPSEMFAGGSKDSTFYGDSGGASRFFYVAKASKRERNAGLEGMPVKFRSTLQNVPENFKSDGREARKDGSYNQNHHPTVKPVKLMEYLITLVTPPGGTVLDPFAGSGTTGVAAKRLGFEFIGCELSSEYVEIAEKRIEAVEKYNDLDYL